MFALLVGGLGLIIGASLHARAQAASIQPVSARPGAEQDQAPNRREFTLTARDYRFSPDRIEVGQDDLVKLTVQSADVAYSLTIDAYRLSRRIPAGDRPRSSFERIRQGRSTSIRT